MKITTNNRIILASESPRRKELFGRLGIPFEIQASGVSEDVEQELSPEEFTLAIATKKSDEVVQGNEDAIVIAADTTVYLGEKLLTKPVDSNQAKEFLQALSGQEHRVITGVSIQGAGISIGFTETTAVQFYELTEEQIDAYVASGDSLDKAGAYGIQTMGGMFVEKINGDYNNVVGLPLGRLFQTLLTLKVIQLEKETSE
ncbi:Maf family protein [Psychrobacillus sp. BL-248-WT-3]|uniref:Maf family protein n=1 Tax=Psychrobacillus sp. BL-248-WT-3 TaxID=2725306 RepID=UPI00146C4735|nr:Maf family protein [Psychrobacillus sp. BL-248-WT-3]NME06173.1 septum formation protein Maf [Psychrobacillus sp. BL-248-WT-3]